MLSNFSNADIDKGHECTSAKLLFYHTALRLTCLNRICNLIGMTPVEFGDEEIDYWWNDIVKMLSHNVPSLYSEYSYLQRVATLKKVFSGGSPSQKRIQKVAPFAPTFDLHRVFGPHAFDNFCRLCQHAFLLYDTWSNDLSYYEDLAADQE